MESVVDRLQQSPVIEAASMGDAPMLRAGSGWNFVFDVPGYGLAPGEDNTTWGSGVMPGYFETLGMHLIAGRDFVAQDRPKNNQLTSVIIINERMARHYFAGRDPVGQFIKIFKADGPRVEIIGVVSDVRSATLRAPRDEFFSPPYSGGWSIVVARPKSGVSIEAVSALIADGVCRSREERRRGSRPPRGRDSEDDRPRSPGCAHVGRLRGPRHRPRDYRFVCRNSALREQPHARDRHSHCDWRGRARCDVDGAQERNDCDGVGRGDRIAAGTPGTALTKSLPCPQAPDRACRRASG